MRQPAKLDNAGESPSPVLQDLLRIGLQAMTTITSICVLMLLLQIKHLIVDWCWQPEYEWKNKGTYGHLGGLRHAAKNAAGTALCFIPFTTASMAVAVLIIDFLIHYHVDWAKMNINKAKGWGPLTHEQFWMLTGADQFMHQVTYLALILLAVS